eukprot:4487116-Amphidinium_carterae.1
MTHGACKSDGFHKNASKGSLAGCSPPPGHHDEKWLFSFGATQQAARSPNRIKYLTLYVTLRGYTLFVPIIHVGQSGWKVAKV